MVKKKSVKFKSHSTPGHQMDLSAWLVELALTRENHGIKLPARFWGEVKYKFRFMREIKAVRKFIREYGEKAMLSIALKEYFTTYTDYSQMEVMLQKIKESKERLAAPKDLTQVKNQVIINGPDLRENVLVSKNKIGMFEKIRKMENDNSSATFSN